MKYKLMLTLALLLCGMQASFAVTNIPFNRSATGTTSATVFVPEGTDIANITDLTYRVDAGVSTATIGLYVGKHSKTVSAAASSGTVVWFENTNTDVAVNDFIIYQDASDVAGGKYLRRVSAATTTSITLFSTTSVTPATGDLIWLCEPVVERAVNTNVSGTQMTSIWLPRDVPSAVVIDGNTTACRISISGYRGSRQ